MSKQAYIGVNGVAKKISKGYIGVNNVAKKITKAYVGVGGVARPCWGVEKQPMYYGSITPMSVARYYHVGSSINWTQDSSYALFAGGLTLSGLTNSVDAYNTSLSRISATPLSVVKSDVGAATTGGNALFAGGMTNSSNTNVVEVYSPSLTRSYITSLSVARKGPQGVVIGNYTLFAGGFKDGYPVNTVDTYDASLTRVNLAPPLSVARTAGAASNDNYAIFAGGVSFVNGLTFQPVVDAYNTSLTRNSNVTPLSGNGASNGSVSGVKIGKYSLFAYTCNLNNYYNMFADAYDSSLTKTTTEPIQALGGGRGVTVNNYAIFAGIPSFDIYSGTNFVDIYDTSLSHRIGTSLANSYGLHAAASVGNYAIFTGGCGNGTNSTPQSFAEAYVVM